MVRIFASGPLSEPIVPPDRFPRVLLGAQHTRDPKDEDWPPYPGYMAYFSRVFSTGEHTRFARSERPKTTQTGQPQPACTTVALRNTKKIAAMGA